MYICIYTYTYIFIYSHMYPCINIHIHVHTHARTCTQTHHTKNTHPKILWYVRIIEIVGTLIVMPQPERTGWVGWRLVTLPLLCGVKISVLHEAQYSDATLVTLWRDVEEHEEEAGARVVRKNRLLCLGACVCA